MSKLCEERFKGGKRYCELPLGHIGLNGLLPIHRNGILNWTMTNKTRERNRELSTFIKNMSVNTKRLT